MKKLTALKKIGMITKDALLFKYYLIINYNLIIIINSEFYNKFKNYNFLNYELPYGESNPGLLGESEISLPLDDKGINNIFGFY